MCSLLVQVRVHELHYNVQLVVALFHNEILEANDVLMPAHSQWTDRVSGQTSRACQAPQAFEVNIQATVVLEFAPSKIPQHSNLSKAVLAVERCLGHRGDFLYSNLPSGFLIPGCYNYTVGTFAKSFDRLILLGNLEWGAIHREPAIG